MKSSSELPALLVVALAALVACTKTEAVPSAHADVRANVACVSCHMPELVATKKPPHEGARPTSCGVCHDQSSWKPFRLDHPGYALTGAHRKAAEDPALAGKENQVKCFWCHRGDASTFAGTKTDCLSCHADDRATSTFPGHASFQSTCQDCHGTEAWKPAKHPPAPKPEPPATAEPTASTSGTPKKPPKPVTPKPKPTATPTAPPTSPPTSSATPPDVISRPSRRR